MATRFRIVDHLRRLSVVVAAGFAGSVTAYGQAVPIPFASTYAGGGTVCATSIPTFAATTANVKSVGDGCPATQATMNAPVAIAQDSYGNLFISDQTNNLVRVVYNGGAAMANAIIAANVQTTGLVPVKGNIYTIVGGPQVAPASPYYCSEAGSGTVGLNSRLDGCPGVQVYNMARGMATDADGNLFISNVAGTSSIRVFYVGGAAAAKLIAVENPTLTTPPQVGYVYPIAGTTTSGFSGEGGLGSKANMNTPRGLNVDANENIIVADTQNSVIRRIDGTTGIITTIVGYTGTSRCAGTTTCTTAPFSGDGSPATSVAVNLDYPYGVAFDRYGNMFFADSGSGTPATPAPGPPPGRIRVVYAGGTLAGITSPVVGNVYTYAGGAPVAGGTATTQAQQTVFQYTYGLNIDPAGYLYIDDYRLASPGSNHLWKVDPTTGNIAIIAGNSGTAAQTTGARCNGLTTGPVTTNTRGDGCPATQAYLNIPQQAPLFDAMGSIYFVDRGNNVVRKLTYNNIFPATATGASVTQPLAFLYPAGAIPVALNFTTQGSAGATDFADGGGDTCAVSVALAATTTCVDYVKFTPSAAGLRTGSLTVTSATGNIAMQTLSGSGAAPVMTIDPGTAKALGTGLQPLGVSADQLGNVYVSDGKGKQLLRTTIAGTTSTAVLSGLGTPRQSVVDGYGDLFVVDSTNNNLVELTAGGVRSTPVTDLTAPQGVAADVLGNVYVADTGANRIVYYSPTSGNEILVGAYPYTLNAPTSLTLDAAGDLFIVDSGNTRVLEIPVGMPAQVVALPPGVVASAVAADAGGSIYVADSSSGKVVVFAGGTTAATTLASGFTTPVGLAVGPTGNVFVADSAQASVQSFNRGVNTTVFATTNIGLSSLPSALSVGNSGNLPFTLTSPTFTETGSAAAFPATGTATCTPALVVAPGAFCSQSFQFQPTATGTQSASVSFNATTGQTATAALSGTAINLITTQTAIALTAPANGVVNYGQTATYSVTITPKSMGGAAPTGTLMLLVDGAAQSTKTVSANPYTFVLTLSIGTHTVAAIYSGDANYAGSNTTTSITVGKAITATTASYNQQVSGIVLSAVVAPASTGASGLTGNVAFAVDGIVKATVPVGNGTVSSTVLIADGAHTYAATYSGDADYAASASVVQTLTVSRAPTVLTLTSAPVSSAGASGLLLTAKLSSTAAGTPSGTITFLNGTTVLGTVTLTATGTAALTTNTVTYTSYTFTATYSGDGLYQPALATITQGADFVVVSPVTVLAIPQGGQAIGTVGVMPINGYAGSLTASCSNLPANALCRFSSSPLALNGAAGTLSVQVFTGINANIAEMRWPLGKTLSGIGFALLILSPVAFRRRRKLLPGLLALIAVAAMLAGVTGCGVKTPAAATQQLSTPAGAYAVSVTLTDASGLARTGILNVTVEP